MSLNSDVLLDTSGFPNIFRRKAAEKLRDSSGDKMHVVIVSFQDKNGSICSNSPDIAGNGCDSV